MRPPSGGLALRIPATTLLVVLMTGVATSDNTTVATTSAANFPLLATEPDAADAEVRIMPMTTNLPWGAVGFVDNGCTGTLIDSQHVLAASHCFTFDYDDKITGKYQQGAWQTGLVFFPNYHPARPNPPRYSIDRVVVGSRVQTGDEAVAADWGIGHLTTPVSGFPTVSIDPLARWRYPSFVLFAGYARDNVAYPNGPASYPQPSPGGYCPNFGNNCWWIPAFVDPKCLALDQQNGVVRLDNFSCLVQGGNSGSPVFWDAGSAGASAFRLTGVISGGGGFWSASRFQHAPRFAAGVAVASHDDGTARTQVFATDHDLGRVVSRHRIDTTTSGPFTYFRDLGTVPRPGRLAAFRLQNGRPQVVVVSDTGKLYTSYVSTGGQWQTWQMLAGPAVSGILDIAATTDSTGLPQLYVIGGDHALYVSRATSATWGGWIKIPVGVDAQRVSVVRHADGRQQILVVSTARAIHSVWQVDAQSGSAWSTPGLFGNTPALADVSAAWTPDGRVQLFAIDETGGGWTRTAVSLSPNGGWNPWTVWSVPLYAPAAATPPKLDGLVSVTASRWLEGRGAGVPVVFATDRQGNLYVTTYESGQWRAWRSFYN